MIVLSHERLRGVAARILSAAGAAEVDAATVADHLVDANLAGHDSHGVAMVPYYVKAIRAGILDPRAHAAIEDGGGAALAVDGRSGFGQVVAREGIAAGIARVRASGVAAVALRDAFHVGRVGAYAEQAAAAGLVSIHFANVVGHAPFVAPFRGSDARLSTNPFCVGVPGPDGRPALLLDFATSHVAYGKVRNAHAAGAPAPPGALIDARGRPTNDAAVMFREPRGAMRPFGDYKGSGLALACELLAGVVSGGGTLPRVPMADARITNNMLSLLLDPGRFPGGAAFAAEIAEGIGWVKASPPADPALPVLVAGEPEAAARAARLASGIPVAEAIWEEIRAAGRSVGAAELGAW
jgi:uncharacterized oxidoreductase